MYVFRQKIWYFQFEQGFLPKGVSSTMTKVKIAKDIHFQMWKFFDIWCEKRFAILVGQIQSKQIHRLVTYILASP